MRLRTWIVMASLLAPVLLVVLLFATGVLRAERTAAMRAQCTSCGMVTNNLFYRISSRVGEVNIPYGFEVYGGSAFCPHTLVYP